MTAARKLSLAILLDGLVEIESFPGPELTGLALDSRQLRPGDAFIALRGATGHGLDFAAEAYQRGAVAVVHDGLGSLPENFDLPTICIPDLAAQLPSLAARMWGETVAGMDLIAAVEEGSTLRLSPGESRLIPTGLILQLPPGFEGQVRPRSGLALRNGVTVLNAPGTVDADYRGEVQVLLVNLGREEFTVTRGMRVAQMVVAPVVQADLNEAAEVELEPRGAGDADLNLQRDDHFVRLLHREGQPQNAGDHHADENRGRPAGRIVVIAGGRRRRACKVSAEAIYEIGPGGIVGVHLQGSCTCSFRE